MRLLLDTLVAFTLLAILAGVIMYNRQATDERSARELAQSELARFQQQINFQSAMLQAQNRERKYPASVDPAWFQGSLPQNPLVGSGHPWVEIAGLSQRGLEHPPNKTAVDSSVAAFWYSPFTGVVRARVPVGVSDAGALKLYNEINDCTAQSLFAGE